MYSEHCLTGTWVSFVLQKAVAIGYVIVAIYELWNYNEMTVYDKPTSEGGLFAQYMNTFMKIKMDVSGYHIGCTTSQEKIAFIARVCSHERINLSYAAIIYSAGSRTVAKICLKTQTGALNSL